jgi:hypothetical protein
MSARLPMKGVHVGPVYAAPMSRRYYLRRRRLARVRGWLLRSFLPWLVLCLVAVGIPVLLLWVWQ